MIRLAIELADKKKESDYRAAASRISDAKLVSIHQNPDALVSDCSDCREDGKPVLLVDTEPRSGTRQIPAFPWRHAPQVRAIRESLDAGELGLPGLMRMSLWHPTSRELSDRDMVFGIDLVRWLMRDTPNHSHFTEIEHGRIMHFGFSSGAMAMIDLTTSMPEGEGYHSLYVIGSRGTAYADDHYNRNLFFEGGASRASAPVVGSACIQPMLETFFADVQSTERAEKALLDYRKARDLLQLHQRIS